jgi:protein-disulfide isomerase
MDAPMTLVEYGDYECPACGAAHPLTEALVEELGDDLRFVFRHFPLANIHPHAEHAAEAAEAAGAQRRYWEMHDVLFRNQDALEDEDLVRYAASLGLTLQRFVDALTNDKYSAKVEDDFRSGVRSGVNGTPTFFVNDIRYDGPRDLQLMVTALNETAQTPHQ